MEPLIKKYSAKLNTEDAQQEYNVFLLNLMKNIKLEKLNDNTDYTIINYIKNSIHHEYIRLLKEIISDRQNIYYIDDEKNDILQNIYSEDNYTKILLEDLKRILSSKEYEVIFCLFYLDMSVKDISLRLNTSKWNIYKIKNSALSKLKKEFTV